MWCAGCRIDQSSDTQDLYNVEVNKKFIHSKLSIIQTTIPIAVSAVDLRFFLVLSISNTFVRHRKRVDACQAPCVHSDYDGVNDGFLVSCNTLFLISSKAVS